MKKTAIVFTVILILLTLASCSDSSEENIVHPPIRISENISSAQTGLNENLNELIERSDLIVRLRVKNWLGEVEFYERTCFEAEILENYKGNADLKNIILT